MIRHPLTTHGLTHSPEWSAWRAMRERCHKPTHRAWKNYGGRGISVCPEWRQSFESFFAELGPRPSPKHQLDRINNDGNYEPGNCRWATRVEQARNKRTSATIRTPGGKVLLLVAAEAAGIRSGTLKARLRRGWPIARALDPTLGPSRWRR